MYSQVSPMAYSNISDPNPSNNDWDIKVRLCRMWEAVNHKNDKETMGLEMVVVYDKVYACLCLYFFS